MATESLLEAAKQHLASACHITAELERSDRAELSNQGKALSSHLSIIAAELERAEMQLAEQAARINQLSSVVGTSLSRFS